MCLPDQRSAAMLDSARVVVYKLVQELEIIVGEECRGQSGESRERWGGGVCTAVLKQGELQSGNNAK